MFVLCVSLGHPCLFNDKWIWGLTFVYNQLINSLSVCRVWWKDQVWSENSLNIYDPLSYCLPILDVSYLFEAERHSQNTDTNDAVPKINDEWPVILLHLGYAWKITWNQREWNTKCMTLAEICLYQAWEWPKNKHPEKPFQLKMYKDSISETPDDDCVRGRTYLTQMVYFNSGLGS
jgi:hypothetical protein